jgi:hypothetical protein
VLDLLAELFSSKVRAAVLALLLPRPHLGFSLTDLSRRLGLPVSSVQHECYKLARLGLLRVERAGGARLYRPNREWPLLAPLTALTIRAMPIADALHGAAERVPGLDLAWVAGDATSSDSLYLVIVGELGLEALDGVFERARFALCTVADGDRVELAFFRSADWAARLEAGDPFAAALSAAPRIAIVSAPLDGAEPNSTAA